MRGNRNRNIDTSFFGTIKIVSASSIADMAGLYPIVHLALGLEEYLDQNSKAFQGVWMNST
jgi:hypothetical protein